MVLEEEPQTSLSTDSLHVALKEHLPAGGLRDGARAWCSDGLKAGESTGEGTGVPVYYDLAAEVWMTYRGDTEVST